MPVAFVLLTSSLSYAHPPSPMDFALPQISISPPPVEEALLEPYSPFSSLSPASRSDEDGFRPVHLTPPPTLTRFQQKKSSPLRPCEDVLSRSRGLQRECFEAMLQASKERNAMVGAKKACDLRKEIAIKAHQTKQGTFQVILYV